MTEHDNPAPDRFDRAKQILDSVNTEFPGHQLGWNSGRPWLELADKLAAPATAPAAGSHIVCLCGSMRFEDEIREAAREESIAGHIVVLPLCNMRQPHPLWNDEADRIKGDLDRLHKAKIDLANEIVVVAPGGYIGDSTRSEIAYAEAHGKPVRYWSAPAVDSAPGFEVSLGEATDRSLTSKDGSDTTAEEDVLRDDEVAVHGRCNEPLDDSYCDEILTLGQTKCGHHGGAR